MPVLKVWNSTSSSWLDVGAGGLTNPMTANGDIIIGGASGTPTRLGAGTDGQVLTIVSGAPAYANASGGSLLVSEITVSGSPVTSVDFTGLNGDAAGGYVLEVNHVGAAANNTLIAVYLNGDTTVSNYNFGAFLAIGASTTIRAENNSPAYTANTDIGNTSNTLVDISANGTVMCRGYSKIYNGSSSQTNAVIFYFAQNKTLANVTSINLVSTTVGGIGVGSTFRLYKRR